MQKQGESPTLLKPIETIGNPEEHVYRTTLALFFAAIGAFTVTCTPTLALAAEEAMKSPMLKSGQEFIALLLLLCTVAFVIARLPKVQGIDHSESYRRRRAMNWLSLGFIYAFLYMGRYNLTVSKNAFGDLNLMDNADFGLIFGIGTLVYGCAFLLNGPLTDRFGARASILTGAIGAMVMNLLMGIVTLEVLGNEYRPGPITNTIGIIGAPVFSLLLGIQNFFLELFGQSPNAPKNSVLLHPLAFLYAGNMYFQSFGAVAIVKGNAPWFHIRERGVFGAVFGILISLGIYFAYDWNGLLLYFFPEKIELVFLVPAGLLGIAAVTGFVIIQNDPSKAGFRNFNTGDATSGDHGRPDNALKVFGVMLKNPIIMTIAMIEFCSGFIRQAIMQWGKIFGKQVGLTDHFVFEHWGIMLCCAGILGGVFAGVLSDHLFQSRRGPVAAILYAILIVGAIAMWPLLNSPLLLPLLVVMSLAVIGVHGMLSGTASMDFGGAKNAGIAVGIIDGFVYLGTAVMSFWYSWRLPTGERATHVENWTEWPLWIVPVAVVGFLLALRVWSAKPAGKKAH